jgi:hypothetical protein
MERRAYELSSGSPLRVPDPDSLHPSNFRVRPPKHPDAFEPSPQLSPFGGFPVGTGAGGQEKQPGMGSLEGFNEQRAENEPAGASFRVRQWIGGDAAQAVSPVQTPNWLGGLTLGPAIPRWEEQPERQADNRSIAPSPDTTVSPTASSY